MEPWQVIVGIGGFILALYGAQVAARKRHEDKRTATYKGLARIYEKNQEFIFVTVNATRKAEMALDIAHSLGSHE